MRTGAESNSRQGMATLTHRARTVLLSATVAAVASLAISPTAIASWESARSVDNPGSTTQTVGATGNYAGLADGGGTSTAFFEQNVGGGNGYLAIGRAPSDAAWSAPRGVSTSSSATATQPISAGADASGDAVGLSVQNAGGVPGIFASSWPVAGQAPSAYSKLMSTTPAQGGLTDPEVAFDSSGNGYAVAGEGQGGTTTTDEPILISAYVNGKWSTPTPIIVKTPGSTATCTNSAIATKGEVCGQEPRMAVSPDGSIVVVFLETVSQIPMVSNQEELFAVTAPSHAALEQGGSGFTDIHQISANPV